MNTRPELTYDGHGINGPDEYRSRVATFTNGADAAKYGPLFATAPDLLAALEFVCEFYQRNFDVMPVAFQTVDDIATAALNKAKGARASFKR
jgi:hypothetical protein